MAAQFDIAVIGGGIHGCGVAQAAAAAGYSVAVLEQNSLAAGTSSRSSKLIHGGLRYLESAQFSLVRQSLREREILLRNAPQLVKRQRFYIPVYKYASRRPWQIAAGLSLYALLGGLKSDTWFRTVRPERWGELDGLVEQDLQRVYQYWDAQTDDAALTRAVMYSATQLGAVLHCPARVNAVQHDGRGYRIEFSEQDKQQGLDCTCLVNAAGPWVPRVQEMITPVVDSPAVDLVQGSHIVIEQPAPSAVYYVESLSDHRVVFIMPWQGKTLVGTTETKYRGDPAEVAPTRKEIAYLTDLVRHYFPHFNHTVVEQFAGLRVLPREDERPFHRPRETVYFEDQRLPGYLALLGGKLTGYRAVAEKTIKMLKPNLPPTTPRADTRTLELHPAPESFPDSPLRPE
jgi:glycerol-3-phosphate dehydrogenase